MTMQESFGARASHARIHHSVKVDLEARFMTPSGEEHSCRIVEMSTGEIVFATPVTPRAGDKIIVYVAELGRFEGEAQRWFDGGFSIALTLSEAKHRKLAGQLVWFANRETFDLPDERRHKRIVPRMQWTRATMPDGKEKIVRINDISLSGVSVESAAAVSIGDRVSFGLKTTIVTRLVEGGFVGEFIEPFKEGELTESTRI